MSDHLLDKCLLFFSLHTAGGHWSLVTGVAEVGSTVVVITSSTGHTCGLGL